jgi:hypothetical protein
MRDATTSEELLTLITIMGFGTPKGSVGHAIPPALDLSYEPAFADSTVSK